MPQSSGALKRPKLSSLKLWPEQQRVYRFAISRPASALLCEQRTGKTYVTLAILRKLAGAPINLTTGEGNNFCGLLVTLLTNRDSTWLEGIHRFLPWLNVTSDWEKFKKLPNPRVLLIHYEMLPKLISKLVKYKKLNWACVDEAQRIANRGNAGSRAMARLSWIERKLVLTGTPQEGKGNEIGNGGETDYFGIFKFLDPEVFGTNWAEFEKRYMVWRKLDFEEIPYGSKQWQQRLLQQRILKNKAKFNEARREEFIEKLRPHCIRLTKEDVGILQAKVHKVEVKMSPEQRRCYDDMLEQSFTKLPARRNNRASRVLAELKVTNIMKRRQIASGFVYDDDENLRHLSRTKLERMMELIDTLPRPVVVFTAFRPDNDLVTRRLRREGHLVVQVNGSTPKKDRPSIWKDFQAGMYDIAVVQVRTGGVGVDLWKASNAIVYSMTHSYRDWDQMKSRLDSRDKTSPSEFFVLCSKNTIDEDLFDLVIVKKFNTEQTLKHLKQGVRQCPHARRRTPKRIPRRSRLPTSRSTR